MIRIHEDAVIKTTFLKLILQFIYNSQSSDKQPAVINFYTNISDKITASSTIQITQKNIYNKFFIFNNDSYIYFLEHYIFPSL